MISVDSYEFVSISSSFSFDLAGATLSSHAFFLNILTPFMRTSSYYIFQGFQRQFSTRKKMKTEFIIYILIIPSFYKFVIVINSWFFLFFFKKKKFSFVLFILIRTPSLYASMLTSGNWSSLSSTRSGRMSCCACSGKRAICGISSSSSCSHSIFAFFTFVAEVVVSLFHFFSSSYCFPPFLYSALPLMAH